MTAAYALGQIAGPPLATALVARTGGFSASLAVAAGALLLGADLRLDVARDAGGWQTGPCRRLRTALQYRLRRSLDRTHPRRRCRAARSLCPMSLPCSWRAAGPAFPISDEEARVRVDLAAAYRLAALGAGMT
jgi:hypothetical protein